MTVNSPMPGSDLDPNFIERERNRLAGRALAFLIGLNGVAALVLLTIVAMEPQATVDRKVTMAMLVFSGGALAALFSSFLAYVTGRCGLNRQAGAACGGLCGQSRSSRSSAAGRPF